MNLRSGSVLKSSRGTQAPTVHLERMDGGSIAVLTLDDPERANAMSPEMGDAFSAAVRELGNDQTVRAAIIRGAGKDFSIGGHRDMLIELGAGKRSERELRDFMLAFYDRWLPMIDLKIPLIAALQGDCIGVAPVFACVPDIVLADETLNLRVTFAGLGLYPGMALPQLLLRRVGVQQAARLLMAGQRFSGREAERVGLVACCVPAGKVFDEALRVARDIVAAGPSVIQGLKSLLGIKRADLVRELEANAERQAKDFQTPEYRERIARYLPDHYT